MDTVGPIRLYPTMPMIVQAMEQLGWEVRSHIAQPQHAYRGIRLYHGQTPAEDMLYLLLPEETRFPFDEYAYLSGTPHPGQANHLICPHHTDAQIMDFMLELFALYQSWENAIDMLLYRNGTVQELCELGAQLLENPVCIHDDWFVMVAATREFAQIMEPEYMLSSAKGFVPRAVMEDFQHDSDYLETYSHREAQIWEAPERNWQTLYVNLWDGNLYKGRLLVGRKNRSFRHRDFLLAEVLAQRAVLLMRRKQLGEETLYQNMDDLVFSLLQGKQPETLALKHFLELLRWKERDLYLCIRVKGQQNTDLVMDRMLHSDLFRSFPGSYVLLSGQEQCVVLDLGQTGEPVSRIRHALAPVCRDYCLYAGISDPVSGIRELNAAYYQAGAALDQAFRLRSDRWIITFSQCVLEHLMQTLPAPLTGSHLVAPELTALREYDREKGSQLFETFREYLLRDRDIPQTAQALIIHRTTLIYRLNKIRSMLAVDLEDPWQRLRLMLSLWILEQDNAH